MEIMRMGVGLIGCGQISGAYLRNASHFEQFEIRAVADRNPGKAAALAQEFGIASCEVNTLLERSDIDIILNLTPPAAHFAVTMAALRNGKHVYSEKPLAASYAEGQLIAREANARGLVVAVAPDTFLGAAHQTARRLLDEGEIGHVMGGVAFFLSPGMEDRHPNAEFFFKKGGGPLFDVAPYYLTVLLELLGPVQQVVALSCLPRATRVITAPGPKAGTQIEVEVPTTFWCLLSFACGAQVSLGASWDVETHSLPHIELYGSKGTMRLPDPDQFGGSVRLGNRGAWRAISSAGQPFGGHDHIFNDYRGLGLADMVVSLHELREPRASLSRALHIIEIGEALSISAKKAEFVALSTCRDVTSEGDEPFVAFERQGDVPGRSLIASVNELLSRR